MYNRASFVKSHVNDIYIWNQARHLYIFKQAQGIKNMHNTYLLNS